MFDPVTGVRQHINLDGSVPVSQVSSAPFGSTQITASATGTTGATAATLAGVAGKTTYITSMTVTEKNPTAAIDITVVTTGLATNLTWNMHLLATGAAVPNPPPLTVVFNPPIPASAVNTAIVVTAGAAGAGGVSSVNLQGYQL